MAQASLQTLQDLREQIKRLQAAPSAQGPGVLATGFSPLDALLPGGGLPLGRVLELCGEPGSGKTTVALKALAAATDKGPAAYLDPAGELYPPAAAALGVELSRLLIVRPDDPSHTLRMAALLCRSGAFGAVAVDLPASAGSKRLSLLGPMGRRLLEACETGRSALLLLSTGPSGLDASLRVRVERRAETRLALTLERSRLGAVGKQVEAALPDVEGDAPLVPAVSALPRLREVGRG